MIGILTIEATHNRPAFVQRMGCGRRGVFIAKFANRVTGGEAVWRRHEDSCFTKTMTDCYDYGHDAGGV